MSSSSKSPYIANDGRLADVIAAIQATGMHGLHLRSFEDWAAIISGDSARSAHWKKVFEDHPEFFRLDPTRTLGSLVWRQQLPRFHLDSRERISPAGYRELSDEQKSRVSRDQLKPADIKALIETAIHMHSRAVEIEREARWWIPVASVAFTVLGSLVGAILGVTLKN